MTDSTEAAKTVVDALSVGTVVATLAGVLPSIAAIFTIFWTGIRIYETETIQELMNRRKRKPNKDQE
jgi:chromate transport protein ChrA